MQGMCHVLEGADLRKITLSDEKLIPFKKNGLKTIYLIRNIYHNPFVIGITTSFKT